jgi:hypothetical protein
MLLPLLYSYKCLTLDKPIAGVLERKSSYSRSKQNTYDELIAYHIRLETIILQTLDGITTMPIEEKERYRKSIHDKYLLEKYNVSMGCFKTNEAKKYRREIRERKISLKPREDMRFYLMRFPILYKILRALQ